MFMGFNILFLLRVNMQIVRFYAGREHSTKPAINTIFLANIDDDSNDMDKNHS